MTLPELEGAGVMISVKELLEKHDFFDTAVLRHGFTDYMRDYEIIIAAFYSHHEVYTRYQFIGCVEAVYESVIRPDVLKASLPDRFVFAGPDYPDVEDPAGYIWGVRYSTAYPGLEYVLDGKRAKHWARKLGRPMHEIALETECYLLRLVFADIRVEDIVNPEVILNQKDYPLPVVEETSDGGVI